MCLLLLKILTLNTLVTFMRRADGAVLDPALYLSPSPPLTISSNALSPGERWTQPGRVTRDAEDKTEENKARPSSTKDSESMESSETFWPGLRPTSYGLRGIHIPLTFSISGTYGSGGYGSGVIGSSYGSISEDAPSQAFGKYGKAGLAGSSYGSYGSGYPGIRLFGSSRTTGWSGWGNGKWGHYGKG